MTTPNETKPATTQTLETATCSRCGGSGRYSYCQTHGDRCFKCGGVGRVYTKRGRAARLYLEALRSKRADEVTVGDVIFSEGFNTGSFAVPSKWVRVTEVGRGVSCWTGPERTPVEQVRIVGEFLGAPVYGAKETSMGLDFATLVRVRQTKEGLASTFAAALAYQATLTKDGTPRKRGARG